MRRTGNRKVKQKRVLKTFHACGKAPKKYSRIRTTELSGGPVPEHDPARGVGLHANGAVSPQFLCPLFSHRAVDAQEVVFLRLPPEQFAADTAHADDNGAIPLHQDFPFSCIAFTRPP
jgi:hypothetical protein